MATDNKLLNFLNGNNVVHGLPFLPFTNETSVKDIQFGNNQDWELWRNPTFTDPSKQFFPLAFSKTGGNNDIWYLPYEPILNISGRHQIIKRNVAKSRPDISPKGTIKEHWSQDDYEIEITGVLMGALQNGNVEDCYPIEQFNKLMDYLTSGRIYIFCEPLVLLDIFAIVVKDFDFPFTKGKNVQAYKIKAYSDSSYNFKYNRTTGLVVENNSIFLN